MVEFTVKEISKATGTTTQNIYKKIDFLIEKGLAYRNLKGKPIIFESGYNYLVDQQKNKPIPIQSNAIASAEPLHDTTIIETLQKQVAKYEKEIDEWKQRFDRKDKEFTEFATTQQLLLSAKNEEIDNSNKTVENLKIQLEIEKQKKWYQKIFNK